MAYTVGSVKSSAGEPALTNKPVKVVQSLAGAPFGGAENFYTRMVCALADQPQIEQYALTRANEQRVAQIESAGVPVSIFRFGGKLDLIDHYRYRKALKQLVPDVVLAYMNRASGLTPRGNYQLVCRLGHYYDLKYYRHADYWIGNTKDICDYLIKGGMPADRVVHIPNFADEAPSKPIERTSFNTPVDQPLLLAAGRLHVNKAFDTLLRCLVGVPDCTLWLAGDGPEKEALHNLCSELGLSERVRFLGWRNDIAALMQAADIFVCPSRYEGLGNIVLESWLNGCPIIATASEGPRELIENGHTGVLTPIDDVASLTDAVLSMINSEKMQKQLSVNARAYYDSHYSKKVIMQQYADLMRDLGRKKKR